MKIVRVVILGYEVGCKSNMEKQGRIVLLLVCFGVFVFRFYLLKGEINIQYIEVIGIMYICVLVCVYYRYMLLNFILVGSNYEENVVKDRDVYRYMCIEKVKGYKF